MGSESEVQCYNKGCGQKFDPKANTKDSCLYHPGPPYFHDAYKIWQCCNKKSTDFGTWLSYKGCTKGAHSNEKPPELLLKQPAAQEIRPERQEDVIVWNGLNKPAERPPDSAKKDLMGLKVEISEAALLAIRKQKEVNDQEAEAEDNLIGAACQNNSCRAIYRGSESTKSECVHHPGVAVFHEGMKYWSCCQRKTSDFSTFLDQEGCTIGEHAWSKKERIEKIREDWYSRCGLIHINIYSKGALPENSTFESDGFILRVNLVHGFGEKETQLNYELFGEIVPQESRVVVGERKVEIVLKQASAEGWPSLRYDRGEQQDKSRES